ncbi:type VII toxin-antitoxin system HepT family RNase toxin [Natronobiforma cellulositropha]|uniref:type VII toxin-antitoxin system HepT family RNase toxin n=1 Tax=Natronobiforma cellulositropha TaxID=1679076 RepID=UPI0021D5E2CD|nr:DUF86 domain-containing protein [Natronobiforma cellulositropha]
MAGDPLSADSLVRIADAIESIQRNVSALREKQHLSRATYKADGNQDLRDAVERKFEKLTEAVLDIADQICKHERELSTTYRKERIRVLEDVGIISPTLSKAIQEAVGFRDVLSHSYGPIVNDDLVYDALQHGLERYVEFAAAIRSYVQE